MTKSGFPSLVRSFTSCNCVAKRRQFLSHRARDGEDERASSAAEDKGFRVTRRSNESVGHSIGVDITGIRDGKSELSVFLLGGMV